MARAHSLDLRERVVAAVMAGELSRREAASRFGAAASTAVKWVDRYRVTRCAAPGKMGGHKPKEITGTQGDGLELFEYAEEIFDEVAPFVHFCIKRDKFGSSRMLGDDNLGAAVVQLSDDVVAVEGLVGEESVKLEAVDERGNADGVEAVARQEHEAYEVAQGVGQGQDLGRHAAVGAAYGLAPSPPFAPWPCR